MKTKNGFILPLILIVGLVAIVGVGAYFYSKAYTSTTPPNTIVVPHDETPTPTSTSASTTTLKTISTTPPPASTSGPKPDLTVADINVATFVSGGLQRIQAQVCNYSDVGVNSDNLGQFSNDNLPKMSVMFSINGSNAYYQTEAIIFPQKCDSGHEFVEANPLFGPFKGITTGYYDVTVTVDRNLSDGSFNNKIDESNESNNSLTKRLYLNFNSSLPGVSISSPTTGVTWSEGQTNNIAWTSSVSGTTNYRVTIGNFTANTSKSLAYLASSQNNYSFVISDGFVNSMFLGNSKGKTPEDIKNAFYIQVDALDASGKALATGKTGTFTILP